MNETHQQQRVPLHKSTRLERAEARLVRAETRTELAETRTEQAKNRTESAETRAEEAQTRTEAAKTRAEHAETRSEQAETRAEQAEDALERSTHKEVDTVPPGILPPVTGNARQALERLTERQREVLQHLASGQNTKQTASLMGISPKTVEYHRLKLMEGLNIHDIPGLVRFALRVGMTSPEG